MPGETEHRAENQRHCTEVLTLLRQGHPILDCPGQEGIGIGALGPQGAVATLLAVYAGDRRVLIGICPVEVAAPTWSGLLSTYSRHYS